MEAGVNTWILRPSNRLTKEKKNQAVSANWEANTAAVDCLKQEEMSDYTQSRVSGPALTA